jgi:hypothetical protein
LRRRQLVIERTESVELRAGGPPREPQRLGIQQRTHGSDLLNSSTVSGRAKNPRRGSIWMLPSAARRMSASRRRCD